MNLFRTLTLGVCLALAAPAALSPTAFADKKSEAYVLTNANTVLKVLNDASLTDAARRQKFDQFMHQFANIEGIARRALGRFGRSLNDQQFATYYKSFENYAIEVYAVQLDPFRGEAIKVTGSRDIDEQRSQVSSVVVNSKTGKDTRVVWDVLQSKEDPSKYQVRDVGIDVNGSVIWLAQDQQAQFEAFLDRNDGDVSKLVARIDQMTASMANRQRSTLATAPAKTAASKN